MARGLLVLTGTLSVFALVLGGCGGNSEPAAESTSPAASSAPESVTLRGQFAPVMGAPPAAQGVTGTAEEVRTPNGATVTIDLAGLAPQTEYVAHLHVDACSAPDPGGPHFKFDPNGADTPPNEVHLMFTSDAAGAGTATTEVSRPLPDGEAMTVVVHEAGGHGAAAHGATPKLVCADVA